MTNQRFDDPFADQEAIERDARVGRLHDMPGVSLRPLRTPLSEHIRRAPAWLKARIEPLTPLEERLWALLKDPARLGTEAVAKVPIWVPEFEAGYIVDFLLPACSVAVVIEPPLCLDDDDPEEARRSEALVRMREDLGEEGIETIGFYPEWIEEDPELVLTDIRLELGFE